MPKEICYLNLGEVEMGGFPLKFIINMVNEKAFSWVEGFTMVTMNTREGEPRGYKGLRGLLFGTCHQITWHGIKRARVKP